MEDLKNLKKPIKEKKVLKALEALAQESRLAIFRLLMGREAGMAAGEIAETLGIPSTTMSFHLAQLREGGLVKSVKQGRSIIYSARRKRAKRMAKYILATEPETKVSGDELESQYNL